MPNGRRENAADQVTATKTKDAVDKQASRGLHAYDKNGRRENAADQVTATKTKDAVDKQASRGLHAYDKSS